MKETVSGEVSRRGLNEKEKKTNFSNAVTVMTVSLTEGRRWPSDRVVSMGPD